VKVERFTVLCKVIRIQQNLAKMGRNLLLDLVWPDFGRLYSFLYFLAVADTLRALMMLELIQSDRLLALASEFDRFKLIGQLQIRHIVSHPESLSAHGASRMSFVS
jgi:hypothetical protein